MCQPQLFETGRGTPSLHLDCEMAQEDKIGHMEMILVHSGTYKPLQVSQTESYLNQEIKRPSLGAEGAKNGKLGSFQRSETPESHSNLEGGNSLLSPYSSALTQYVGSRRLRFLLAIASAGVHAHGQVLQNCWQLAVVCSHLSLPEKGQFLFSFHI